MIKKSTKKTKNREVPKNDLIYYNILKLLNKERVTFKGFIIDDISSNKRMKDLINKEKERNYRSIINYRINILKDLELIEERMVPHGRSASYPHYKITEKGKMLLKHTPEEVAKVVKAYSKLM